MRHCGFPDSAGFTLLEMSLSMVVSGLLATLMVAAWIQAQRAGASWAQEASVSRQADEQIRTLQAALEGCVWTSSSHLPQGTFPWSGGGEGFTFWSRTGRGALPGPVLWRLAREGGQWILVEEDGWGLVSSRGYFPASEARLEVAKRLVTPEGESLQWIAPSAWNAAEPFRPLGHRICWITPQGRPQELTQWP